MITSLNQIFDIIFGVAFQDVCETARKTSSFLNSNLWLVLVHLFEICQLDKSLNSKGWILKFHCPQRMSSFTLAANCLGLKRTRERMKSTFQHRWSPWDNISSSLCQYTLNKKGAVSPTTSLNCHEIHPQTDTAKIRESTNHGVMHNDCD